MTPGSSRNMRIATTTPAVGDGLLISLRFLIEKSLPILPLINGYPSLKRAVVGEVVVSMIREHVLHTI